MFNPDSQDRLTQYFLEEVTELLEIIEQNLYSLLEAKTVEKVHTLMRGAHTIKGDAANMGLTTIETIAHHLEDVFQSLYAEELVIDPELGSLLLDGYECLRNPLTATLGGNKYDEESALDLTATVFAKLQGKLGDFFDREAPIPSSEELGFDVVGSIFVKSIPQDLEDLEGVIQTQDTQKILDKLVYLTQFIQNIGLSYNLPGLTAIAEVTLVAAEKNPDNIALVATTALANFYQARNQILYGDRNSGVDILAQLQELAEFSPASISEPQTEVVPTNDRSVPPLATSKSKEVEDSVDFKAAMPDLTVVVESPQELPATQSITKTSEKENSQVVSNSQVFASLFEQTDHELVPVAEVDPIDRILGSVWIANVEPAKELPVVPAATSKVENLQSQTTVRVAVEQLENLSQAMGELLIDDNLQTLQAEQFHNLTRQALKQHRFCQQQLNEIYDWWDKQVFRSRYRRRLKSRNSGRAIPLAASNDAKSRRFDLLEMDVYNDLHVLLQNFDEKITTLGTQIEKIEKIASESRFNNVKRKQALTQANDNLLNAKMESLAVILERFPRVLKQIVASHKKPAKLELKGTEIQIDKAIADKLYEPILHLVRNAYDHGLEDSTTRSAQNKPATGTIAIKAYNQGNRTFIEIEDDGSGLDWQRIKTKAIEQNILTTLDAEKASQTRLAEILFQPGFSTADSIDKLSGRGVGLDVVRNQIESLGGKIYVKSQVSEGTKFTLQFPLKSTTSRLLICQDKDRIYAILSDTVIRIIVPQLGQITTQSSPVNQEERSFFRWSINGQEILVPIVDISSSINYQYPLIEANANSILKTFPVKKSYRLPPLLLLKNQQEYICLRVTEIILEQELVIKSLGEIVDLPDYIQGYTVLGDGSFTLVIEPHLLLSQGWQDIASFSSNSKNIEATLSNRILESSQVTLENTYIDLDTKRKLLVIEDSVFQRQSLVNTLEKFNYTVVEASNGQEAIEKLQQNKDIDLIVSDIEMPIMNGFEFLSYRKQDSNISLIPVVVVTTRSSQQHREMAFSLGAEAYHTKPHSDSELLDSIFQLINQQ